MARLLHRTTESYEEMQEELKEFERVVREFAALVDIDPRSVLDNGAVEAEGLPVCIVPLGEQEGRSAMMLAVRADDAADHGIDYYKSLLQLNAVLPQALLQFALLPEGAPVVKRSFTISSSTTGQDLADQIADFVLSIAKLHVFTPEGLKGALHV